MRALPHQDVTAAVATVQASNAAVSVKLAFEYLVLTPARWGEVRGARWNRGAHVRKRPDGAPRSQSARVVYFASGSGRSWKCTTLLGVPLPVSVWNGARVP